MAGQNPPGGLAATARSFTPSQVQITAGVLDATFVTNTLPDINQNAGIVGICLVPEHRADPTDMGWHISDFLAFKTLLCGENHPKAQTWLSLCDIPKLVEQNPEHYAHGKERRNVSNAALVHTVNLKGREVERTDNLQVITSPEDMKTAFLGSITDKAKIASNFKIPLVIIVCGLTTVDQDFYFGKTEASEIFRISQLRDLLADDIDTMVITSAQFSAGWQINPSFIRSPVTKTRAKRDDFLARQTSGVFARSFADQFGTWKCPLLQPNASEQVFEKFPGRARQNEHQKALKEAMETKVVSLMTGRLSAQHQDHSFNFDQAADDWEVLMGPRRYRSLEELKVKWEQHQTTGPVTPFPGSPWSFLGSAFGGNKMSQMMHMQHLVFDARLSWPSYWALRQAAKTMQAMLKVLNDANPEEIKCHELFNALEHRATLGVLVDLLVRYAGLATPLGQRARDWEENRWSASATPEVIRMYNKTFGVTTDIYPGPAVPPGLNVNNLSPIQRRLDAPALYLAAALVTRFLMPGGGIQRLGFLVEGLLHEVKVRQLELLTENTELRQLTAAWIESIGEHVSQRSPEDIRESVARIPTERSIKTVSTPVASSSDKPDNISQLRRESMSAPRSLSPREVFPATPAAIPDVSPTLRVAPGLHEPTPPKDETHFAPVPEVVLTLPHVEASPQDERSPKSPVHGPTQAIRHVPVQVVGAADLGSPVRKTTMTAHSGSPVREAAAPDHSDSSVRKVTIRDYFRPAAKKPQDQGLGAATTDKDAQLDEKSAEMLNEVSAKLSTLSINDQIQRAKERTNSIIRELTTTEDDERRTILVLEFEQANSILKSLKEQLAAESDQSKQTPMLAQKALGNGADADHDTATGPQTHISATPQNSRDINEPRTGESLPPHLRTRAQAPNVDSTHGASTETAQRVGKVESPSQQRLGMTGGGASGAPHRSATGWIPPHLRNLRQ